MRNEHKEETQPDQTTTMDCKTRQDDPGRKKTQGCDQKVEILACLFSTLAIRKRDKYATGSKLTDEVHQTNRNATIGTNLDKGLIKSKTMDQKRVQTTNDNEGKQDSRHYSKCTLSHHYIALTEANLTQGKQEGSNKSCTSREATSTPFLSQHTGNQANRQETIKLSYQREHNCKNTARENKEPNEHKSKHKRMRKWEHRSKLVSQGIKRVNKDPI